MEQSINAVASNLQNIWEDRNLSLEQLSELTGVSERTLRQIDTGRSSPTIGTIWEIANGLRVSLNAWRRPPIVHAAIRSFRGESR